MLGPQDTNEEITPEPQKETATLMPPTAPDDMDRLTVARVLKMDKLDDIKTHERRLNNIIKWAHEKGAKTEVDFMAELSKLRNKLGNPSIFEMNVYVSLELEKMKVMKQEQELDSKLSKFHI
jgi:hypothetical protein